MVKDAEKDGKAVLACRHDERITPVGAGDPPTAHRRVAATVEYSQR